jgi:hypothetical protein
MNDAATSDWRNEFGLTDWTPPRFFATAADLDTPDALVPQAHALRRAFERLGLNGVLCLDNSLVIYFKEIERLDPEEARTLHRQFWNQGLSPVLVLIEPTQVHVYSGLATPPGEDESLDEGDRLVIRLSRIAQAAELHQFILAVESGELFRVHTRAFDPRRRVDRALLRNLEATRDELGRVSGSQIDPRVLDALLCRVVFTCYLFDRGVIDAEYLRAAGVRNAANLAEVVALPKSKAIAGLYALFWRLGEDFNGDLFSDDLDAEAQEVNSDHLLILSRFLSGADVRSGQGRFWPYDFSVIPIETISAIYEHFLKTADEEAKKKSGAFYTPRFLAEVVLDIALEGERRLLDKRFLDPACGSGIFLVGLFNRLAEEWSQKNPGADYATRAQGLLSVLRDNLVGVDENPTACRIAAFSLYLALLDQLRPSHIRELQKQKKFLPRLVYTGDESGAKRGLTIHCGDFFEWHAEDGGRAFDLVVGNPPWAPITGPAARAESWCAERTLPMAGRQLALGFVWKAPEHLKPSGKVCFVLPSGVLFNHQDKAVAFQRAWLDRHRVEVVLNLADYQRFLFEKAKFPALVVRYARGALNRDKETVRYWSPKTDWSVSQAEVISVAPEDRKELAVRELLANLKDEQAPNAWKVHYWASPRDEKLLDRLSLLPRLSENTSQSRERAAKRWVATQGFQPETSGDDPAKSKPRPWPAERLFLEATSEAIELFVLESDCSPLATRFPRLRWLPKATEIFQAPHVLVTKSVRAAYSDFDVVFRHALQGIHGPEGDRDLLLFLAAYLRSSLARFFLFHMTSSWGVSIAEVHLGELLTVPFPFPEQTANPKRSHEIVSRVATRVRRAMSQSAGLLAHRPDMVRRAQEEVNLLIYDYFDIDEQERILVEDTNTVIIPSTRPSRASERVPTLRQSTASMRGEYLKTLCHTLNDWAAGGPIRVSGRVSVSLWSGIGAVELHHCATASPKLEAIEETEDLLSVLDRLRRAYRKELGSVELLRGLKVFDRDRLYLLKPLRQRFWTRTAALNDADEIAAAVLIRPAQASA